MSDKDLILHNVNYFDSLSGQMVKHQTFRITGNKISWIGDPERYKPKTDDQFLDLTGAFLFPGLIDCHLHLEYNADADYEREYLRTKTSSYGYFALKNAQRHLVAGFTTLRDCGGELWGASLRRMFEKNVFYGPRLLVAQKIVSQYGNQEAIGPDELIHSNLWEHTMSGKDGIIHAVRDRVRSGSDFIKTTTTGAVLGGIDSKLQRSFFTDEELEIMVHEAHRLGLHVASHAHTDEGIYTAVQAGVDTIEHGSLISDDTIDLMIEKGSYLVPTQTSAFLDKPELMKALPPEVVEKTIEVDKAMFVHHRRAFEKGVKLALGTDAGVPGNPHGTSAREITCMMKNVGMTPAQALQCATIETARAIKLSETIGSIEVNKFADLVVVEENPLTQIEILEDISNISLVIKNGIIMARKGRLEQNL
ncbi:MAG: amidohydrolase family protein [Promethearchaeota archaeon]